MVPPVAGGGWFPPLTIATNGRVPFRHGFLKKIGDEHCLVALDRPKVEMPVCEAAGHGVPGIQA
jgi:hypothetical protein